MEAQRLGLAVYASDLNPVAVLITKALIEIPPNLAGHTPINPKASMMLAEDKGNGIQGLADDVRYYGQWMYDEARKRIGYLYPKAQLPKEYGGGEAEVVAWLWARTVKCPNPACGAQMPLVNKFWVSTHKGNEAWIEPIVDRAAKTVQFVVRTGTGNPLSGTVNKLGARCLICKSTVSFDHIRTEGQADRMGYQLMAVAAEGPSGRIYLSPDILQTKIATEANPIWVPNTDMPAQALGFRVQRYGILKHRDLFTQRQLTALSTLSDLISQVHEHILQCSPGDLYYANAVVTYLALSVSRLAQTNNTLVRWLVRKTGTSKGTPAFDRPIVSMLWEFSEGNVLGKSVGSWRLALENPLSALKALPKKAIPGKTVQRDASIDFTLEIVPVVSTDPPYFNNIGYADLSDFYYIWLRRSLSNIYPELFSTILVPKKQELIAAAHLFNGDRIQGEKHFMQGLRKAFSKLNKLANPKYPITVYYAFKQAEDDVNEDSDGSFLVSSTGWETMLEALLEAGFLVGGTWPVRTEQASRLRAIGSNALASSIVLVCRPRSSDAIAITRRDFLNALKHELPPALKDLQRGNIAPVDLAQAAIGPGMAVFSRYSKVLESDGTPMRVRTALQLINQTLDEVLAEQEGEYDADTRWAVAWFEQFGMEEGPYGVAETLSKAKNTAVGALVEAGILRAQGGKVRLLRRNEYTGDWNPNKVKRLTAWEVTQRLIWALQEQGEAGAAAILDHVEAYGEVTRDLAYRLYTICERKKWADEALAYNSLVVEWSGISGEAEQRRRTTAEQARMF